MASFLRSLLYPQPGETSVSLSTPDSRTLIVPQLAPTQPAGSATRSSARTKRKPPTGMSITQGETLPSASSSMVPPTQSPSSSEPHYTQTVTSPSPSGLTVPHSAARRLSPSTESAISELVKLLLSNNQAVQSLGSKTDALKLGLDTKLGGVSDEVATLRGRVEGYTTAVTSQRGEMREIREMMRRQEDRLGRVLDVVEGLKGLEEGMGRMMPMLADQFGAEGGIVARGGREGVKATEKGKRTGRVGRGSHLGGVETRTVGQGGNTSALPSPPTSSSSTGVEDDDIEVGSESGRMGTGTGHAQLSRRTDRASSSGGKAPTDVRASRLARASETRQTAITSNVPVKSSPAASTVLTPISGIPALEEGNGDDEWVDAQSSNDDMHADDIGAGDDVGDKDREGDHVADSDPLDMGDTAPSYSAPRVTSPRNGRARSASSASSLAILGTPPPPVEVKSTHSAKRRAANDRFSSGARPKECPRVATAAETAGPSGSDTSTSTNEDHSPNSVIESDGEEGSDDAEVEVKSSGGGGTKRRRASLRTPSKRIRSSGGSPSIYTGHPLDGIQLRNPPKGRPGAKGKGKGKPKPKPKSKSAKPVSQGKSLYDRYAELPPLKAGSGLARHVDAVWPARSQHKKYGIQREIICEHCKGRCHWSCAGLVKEDDPAQAEWSCPDCEAAIKAGTAIIDIPQAPVFQCIRGNCILRLKKAFDWEEGEEEEWVVEKIVGRKAVRRDENHQRVFEYLIKEPTNNFDAVSLIDAFVQDAERIGPESVPLKFRVALLPEAQPYFDPITGLLKRAAEDDSAGEGDEDVADAIGEGVASGSGHNAAGGLARDTLTAAGQRQPQSPATPVRARQSNRPPRSSTSQRPPLFVPILHDDVDKDPDYRP